MLDIIDRPLGENDRITLKSKLGEIRQDFFKQWRATILFTVLGMVFGIPVAVRQIIQQPQTGNLIMALVWSYMIALLWSYFKSKRSLSERQRFLETALAKGKARVTVCRTDKVIQAEQAEDEGPGYFLEVEEGKLFHVSGRGFYPTTLFPNNNFAIVDILNPDGVCVDSRVEFYGHKLQPLRSLSIEAKRKMLHCGRYPQDRQLLGAKLEELERVLLS